MIGQIGCTKDRLSILVAGYEEFDSVMERFSVADTDNYECMKC